MFRKIFVLLLLSFISSNLLSHELIDQFANAVKSKKLIQYSTKISMNDESKGLTVFNCKAAFKIEPKDTCIGAYYNLTSEENTVIYNGNEFLESYPKEYGDKIVKQLIRSKNPEGFSDEKFEMNGQDYIAPSAIKGQIFYHFSIVTLMNDLIRFDSTKPAIILSDTLINGYNTSRIRFTIMDTIIDGEKELIYYLVAFDKENGFPVYFMKYFTSQQTEIFFNDYKFDSNGQDYLFSSKAFPNDYKFEEDPEEIEEKGLDTGIVAPEWTLKSIYDKEISLKDLKGTPVFLIFSEIGCAPCEAAIPDLNEITKIYNNIKVIAIYPKDKREPLKKHVQKKKIIYDVLDNSSDVAKAYHVNGYPTFFFIDKEGILKYTESGYETGMIKELEEKIDDLLKK